MRQIFGALRDRGMSTRSLFGGGGVGGAPLAQPGEYRVTVTVDGRALTQEFRVVRDENYRPGSVAEGAARFQSWDEVFRWLRYQEVVDER